jgi:cardiolipin synthase
VIGVLLEHVWAIASSLELVYVALLATWIVLEKRSPVATLAWILGLAFLPVVGFVLYFFLGPRRLRRKKLRHARSRVFVREKTAPSAPVHELPWKDQLVTLITRAAGAPLVTCSEVTVYGSGAACFDAIVRAIEGACHHVHLLYYIFEDDVTGRRIRDALIARAKAGVKVRLLVDAVGSPLGPKFLRPLREAGAEFARFNHVAFGRLRPRINFRNHRKIVVVDGRVGFLGGINVGDEYTEAVKGPDAYRDTHLGLVGTAVSELQLAFLEDWHFATDKMPDREKLFFTDTTGEGELVQIVASGPDQEWESMQKLFFTAITLAEKRIEITTPYFVPDEPILAAIANAALRGVVVELVVPARSDSRIVSAAGRSYYDQLLKAGVRIHEYPKMIHAKTMVVDGRMGIVGSANMDNRSFRLNFEIGAVFYHQEAIRELERLFAADVRKSRSLSQRGRGKLGLAARLGEASARLLSPLL